MDNGFRFRIGEVFPADSPLAHWLVVLSMGLNDLLLANQWLLNGLEGDALPHENLYRGRLAAMHTFELVKFLHDGLQEEEVRTFVQSLPDEVRGDYSLAVALFDKGNPFRGQIEGARDRFAHYVALDRKAVKKALAELAEEEGQLTVGTKLDHFRAHYGDAVALKLFFAGEEESALRTFITGFSNIAVTLLRFTESALGHYFARLPSGAVTGQSA